MTQTDQGTADQILSRFPNATEAVQAALLAIEFTPLDDNDDHSPCPCCGKWHMADGLPVAICPCGYCAHIAITGNRCDFCGDQCDFCGEVKK